MNSMRRLLCIVSAVMLAALALPANADNKIYNLDITPPSFAAGASGVAVTATFSNVTPDGNSTTKSIKLYAATGITIKQGATISGGYTANVVVQPDGKSVWIDSISLPIKPFGPPMVLNMTVDVACSISGSWTTINPANSVEQVWTGSNFTGQTFHLNASSGTTPTISGGGCSLTFVNQPADALAGSVITTTPFNNPTGDFIKVQFLTNGSPPASPVSVSIASTACSISGSATTDGTGTATFATLKSTATASVSGCVLTASAAGLTATSTSTFNIVAPTGTLGCIFSGPGQNNTGGTLSPDADLVYTGNQEWGLIRGPNTDGGPCTVIPYAFTLNPDNTASFIADKLGQQVIVEYVVVWAPVDIGVSPEPAGWTQRRPLLAWDLVPSSDSDYVPALACVVDDIAQGLNALPMIPDVAPFQGNSHSQYLPNQKAKMCVAQHGWTSVGGGKVQYWSKIIDSDGFVRLP